MKQGICVVVVGVVASGKSTIIKKIIESEPDAVMMKTYTTRVPREGEIEEGDRIFVSRDEFERMIAEGKFIEWDEHFGFLYGASRDTLDKLLSEHRIVLVNVNVDGALKYKQVVPNILTIFITVPEDQIVARIEKRSRMDSGEMARRLAEAKRELTFIDRFDYVVANPDGQLDQAVERVREIIRARLSAADAETQSD